MKIKKYLFILLASLMIVSCSKKENSNIPKAISLSEEENKSNFEKSKELLNKDTIEKFENVKNKNEKLDLVSLEIFSNMYKLMPKNRNFVLSPFSIQSALESIAENMSDKKDVEFLKLYDEIDLEKNFENSKVDDLILVNKKLVEKKSEIGKVKFVDFPKGAMKTYEEFQNKLFGEEIDNTPFGDDTVISVINGIIFSGKWDKPFKQEVTKDREFKTVDGKIIKVPTMAQEFKDAIGISNDSVEAFSMTVGASKVYFIKFNENMEASAENISNTLDKLDTEKNHQKIEFYLPKLNTSTKTDIKAVFNILKIPKLLDNYKMDKIADTPLVVDKAFQVATLKLDEKSIEAKAVTRVDNVKSAAPSDSLIIRMDSPFFIIIKDKSTNSNKENILFTSYIANPTQK